MSRSVKKGFFVDPHLSKKISAAQANDDRKPIQTWSRRSTITPDFVGLNFTVHNDKWMEQWNQLKEYRKKHGVRLSV